MSAARIDATTHTVTTLPLPTEHVEVSSEGTFVRDRVIAVDTAGGAVRSVPIGDTAVDDLAVTTDAMWVLAATLRVGPGSSLTRIELSRLP